MRRMAPMLALFLLALTAPRAEAQRCSGRHVGINGGVAGELGGEHTCRSAGGRAFAEHQLTIPADGPGSVHVSLHSNSAFQLIVADPDGRPVTMLGENVIRFDSPATETTRYARVTLIGVKPGRYTIQVVSSSVVLGPYRLWVSDPSVPIRGTCTTLFARAVALNSRGNVDVMAGTDPGACTLPYGRSAVVRRFTLAERSEVTIRAEGYRAHVYVLRGAIEADSASASRNGRVAELRETLDPGTYYVALGKTGMGDLSYEVRARPASRSAARTSRAASRAAARERAACLVQRAPSLDLNTRTYPGVRRDDCGAAENGAPAVYASLRVPESGHLTLGAEWASSPRRALTLRLFSEDGEPATSLASPTSGSLLIHRHRVTPGVYFVVLHGDSPREDGQVELSVRYQGRTACEGELAELEGQAAAGDASAMNTLANRYLGAYCGTVETERGQRWRRHAADAGSREAQFQLGDDYEYARSGVERDLFEAIRWYEKAAEGGRRESDTGSWEKTREEAAARALKLRRGR